MPPNARVVIFQDDAKAISQAIPGILAEGHSIVHTATSLNALEAYIQAAQKDSFDVALVDRSVPIGATDDPEPVGSIAASEIVEFDSNVTIVAWTTHEEPEYGNWHYNPIEKSGHTELGLFITNLPFKTKEA